MVLGEPGVVEPSLGKINGAVSEGESNRQKKSKNIQIKNILRNETSTYLGQGLPREQLKEVESVERKTSFWFE